MTPEHWKNTSLFDLEGEFWLPIDGYEGRYEASNMGRIKSLSRQKRTRGTGVFQKPEIILQPYKDPDEYLNVCLMDEKGGKKTLWVHILVAKAFIPNPDNKPTVNHKYGNGWDNRVSSLEWHTHLENNRHSIEILGKKFKKRF